MAKKLLVFDPINGHSVAKPGDVIDMAIGTQPLTDNSDLAASTAFAQKLLKQSMAAVVLSNVTGGIYNFCIMGMGAAISFATTNGAITSVSAITTPGSGYAVGDLVTPKTGNYDAILRVVTVTAGGGIGSLVILNGGSGYVNTTAMEVIQALSSGFHFFIQGALTATALFLIPGSSYIENANQWLVSNNTTGLFSVRFQLCLQHTPVGTGTGIPQNLTVNARSYLLATDGRTEIWLVNANILQKIHGSVAQVSGNTLIPFTNAAPTITQGTQLFSATFTPTMIGSDVVIEFSGTVDGSNSNSIITVAVFRGNTFIGFCATSPYSRGTSSPGSISFKINDVVGSLNPVTYSARIGIDTTGTWYLGRGAAVSMGGVNPSNWSIIEELT